MKLYMTSDPTAVMTRAMLIGKIIKGIIYRRGPRQGGSGVARHPLLPERQRRRGPNRATTPKSHPIRFKDTDRPSRPHVTVTATPRLAACVRSASTPPALRPTL